MDSRIILASSSPRRIEMMKRKGIDPLIIPSSAEESLPFPMSMTQSVMYLAFKKAQHVEERWLKEAHGQAVSAAPHVIIAADTIVYKDGIIGKPADRTDAFQILKRLNGTSHFVATGVALVRPGDSKRCVFHEVTEVFFRNYSDDTIHDYLNTDEPWDKAGSYAIQGLWGENVSRIEGDYDNVIGFPWSRIEAELRSGWPEIQF